MLSRNISRNRSALPLLQRQQQRIRRRGGIRALPLDVFSPLQVGGVASDGRVTAVNTADSASISGTIRIRSRSSSDRMIGGDRSDGLNRNLYLKASPLLHVVLDHGSAVTSTTATATTTTTTTTGRYNDVFQPPPEEQMTAQTLMRSSSTSWKESLLLFSGIPWAGVRVRGGVQARGDCPDLSYMFYTTTTTRTATVATMRNVMLRANLLPSAAILSGSGQKDAWDVSTLLYNNWKTQPGTRTMNHDAFHLQYRTFAASSHGPSSSSSGSASSSSTTISTTSTAAPLNVSDIKTESGGSGSGSSVQVSKPKIPVPPVPVPSPSGQETSFSVKLKQGVERTSAMTVSAIQSLATMIAKTPGIMWYYTTHPREFREKLTELKEMAKKEAHHYYMGSKLLMADIKTAKQIVGRTLNGTPLTRRERKQLIRTVTDVFRLVPMSIFVLIPFMEFALPFALKIFPNMLPSTFQDSLKAEENMKRELKSRLAMAEFFQETLQDLAKDQKRRAESRKKHIVDNDGPTSDLESTEDREETAASFLNFIEKARNGEFLPPEVIIRYAKYFKDELTLDNMPRMQLINMCRYMGIPPYGNDNVLRFQLRHKVRGLIEDDQRILWEGIDSLTKMELREACQERGMRSTGLSKEAYKRALQQWIDLSVNRNVPISLLVMSRTFFLQEEMTSGPSSRADESKSVTGLADAISGLDKELVNEVILESVLNDNKQDPELIKLKLKVLQAQNELIEEEKQQREAEVAKAEAAKAEKERAEKERTEKERAEKESKEAASESDAMDKEMVSESSKPSVEDTIVSKDVFVSPAEKQKGHDMEKKHGLDELKGAEMTQQAHIPHETEKQEKSSATTPSASTTTTGGSEEEEERSLSSEELDAISQLVSPDPVSAEREKLLSLKAALHKESSEEEDVESKKEPMDEKIQHEEKVPQDEKIDQEKTANVTSSTENLNLSFDQMDKIAEQQISTMDEAAKSESDASTQISLDGKIDDTKKDEPEQTITEEQKQEDYSNKKLDMAISRLKAKVESMVGNLEIQLSDVESKIGDKLHFLDKDRDGILSREEMAICLQSVLKRPLTFEEAMAIAADMDENEDGFFSLDELSKWLETNRLVRLVEEGRDAEVDKIIETQAAKMKEGTMASNEPTDSSTK